MRDFAVGIEVAEVVTRIDWADAGMAAGTPSPSRTIWSRSALPARNPAPDTGQRGFGGSGTQPGVGVSTVLISGRLAAARITEGR